MVVRNREPSLFLLQKKMRAFIQGQADRKLKEKREKTVIRERLWLTTDIKITKHQIHHNAAFANNLLVEIYTDVLTSISG